MTCNRTRTRSRSLTGEEKLPELPSIASPSNGMRLGTPIAREAAKSFWSMDMLKTSLNKMAFYADCESHSSQGSIGSGADSGFQSSTPSDRATPTVPELRQVAPSSAPSSPLVSATRNTTTLDAPSDAAGMTHLLQQPILCPVASSPLLVARREREEQLLREKETASPIFTAIATNYSSASLTSSSKTLSPSVSAQTLLPRRKLQHHRSLSATEHGHHLPRPHSRRGLKGAWSDTSVHHLEKDASSLFRELHKSLNTTFDFN